MAEKYTFIFSEKQANERLDQALVQLLPDFSRTQIQHWIASGFVTVNGQQLKAKTKMQGGETVAVTAVIKPQPDWKAQALPLAIVYEDEALIVVNKPVGMVVHPGAG